MADDNLIYQSVCQSRVGSPARTWGSKFTRRKSQVCLKNRPAPRFCFPTRPLHQAPTKRYRVIVPTTVFAIDRVKITSIGQRSEPKSSDSGFGDAQCVEGCQMCRPEFWRACRFIQKPNYKISHFVLATVKGASTVANPDIASALYFFCGRAEFSFLRLWMGILGILCKWAQ